MELEKSGLKIISPIGQITATHSTLTMTKSWLVNTVKSFSAPSTIRRDITLLPFSCWSKHPLLGK